jgi:hypothetical protein
MARAMVVHMEDHQRAGIAHRERAVHYLVEQRKDGRVGAYTERQRQNRHGGEHGAASQGTQGKAEIGPHAVQDSFKRVLVVWLATLAVLGVGRLTANGSKVGGTQHPERFHFFSISSKNASARGSFD